MRDNDTVNMDPVGDALAVSLNKRQVRIFFRKAKIQDIDLQERV